MPNADSKGGNRWLVAPVVALAAFMEVLDISIANVSLPHIAGDLSSSQDQSTWVLTSYLVTNAMVMPISGWLSNRFGRKRFFMTCIAGFTLSSFACALAPSLAVLILLRAIQGATGGGLQPSGQAILTDAFPAEQRGMATAIYGVATVFAPTVGPTLGGWITDSYNWRWIFLINVPVGIVLLFLISSLIGEDRGVQQKGRKAGAVDGLGFCFVALALGCLQIVLDRGQQDDWFASTLVTLLTITSAISFVLLVWQELRHPNPMVDLKLMANRDFAIAFILMLMLGFMLLGSTYLIPAYTQSLMGYRATDAGLVITPGGIVIMVLMPVVGRLLNYVDPRLLIMAGLVISGAALLWMTNFYLDISFGTIMLARMAQAAGLALLFIPINTMAFGAVPADRTNNASALINLARNYGASIGISFASTLVTRRSQFHQSRMMEQLQPLNPAMQGYLQQLPAHGPAQASFSDPATLALLYRNVIDQASLLSYLEDFKVLGLVFFLLLPLLLLVRPGRRPKAEAAH